MKSNKWEKYSIVFSGIGGQGLISSIKILGEAFLVKNFHVISAETHGLGQRGGKVNTFLRFGTKKNAPLPLKGKVEMIVATEKSAILDVLKYANPDKSTIILMSTYEKRIVDEEYPDDKYIKQSVENCSNHIHSIPANSIAQNTIKNSRTENTILIGYMLRFLPLRKEDIEKALSNVFSGNVLEANIKALEIGISLE